MTLYEMLDKTKYYQQVWIYMNNAYDQNMPLFIGIADDARRDADILWDYLMCEVEMYYCVGGILAILVRDNTYNERLETHYTNSDRWGIKKETRPWRYSSEIDAELMEKERGQCD